jgi:molybdopterin-guanine dinucleotide biosynthesis protein A
MNRGRNNQQEKLNVTGMILAGGGSTRLGRDKAWEQAKGRPLLQWATDKLTPVTQEIVVVKAKGQELPAIEASGPLRVAEDILPGHGPLGGIYTGLQAASNELSIAVGCDMPLLCVPLLRELCLLAEGYDVVMPTRAGQPQPLHAVYRRSCVEAIGSELEAGRLKVISFLDAVRVRYVGEDEWSRYDPEGLSFLNVNTEEDLRRASRLLSQGERSRQ